MASELAVGYVSLVPSARGFGSKLQSEIDGTAVGRRVGDDVERGIGGRIRGILRSIGTLALATGAVIGAAGGALGLWGLKSAAELQQTQIAFEGIFGSASSANKFIEELRTFAARTPFEFPELAQASKQLLAVGFSAETVIPTMTKIGNVAATLGVGADGINSVVRALGQMKGKGKASAEELQQISEAIPGFSAIGAIAESMGISTADAFKQIEQGAIPADQAIEAILAGMERFPGAAGAMERQAQTLNGVLSTFKDTVRDALVAGIAPVLPSLSTALQDAMPMIGQAMTSIGESFGGLLTAVMPVLGAFLPVFANVADAVTGLLATAFAQLGPIIQSLAPHVQGLLSALQPLLGAIIVGIAPAIQAIAPAFLQLASSLASALLPVVSALAPILARVAEVIGRVVTKVAQSGVIETFGKLLGKVLTAAMPLIDALADGLLSAIDALIPVIDQLVGTFATLISQVLSALAPSLPPLIDAFSQLVVALLPLIPPSLELLLAWTPLIPIVAQLAAMLAGVLTVAIQAVTAIISPLISAVTWLMGIFSSAFSAISDAVSSGVSTVISFVSGLPGTIIGFFTDLPGRMLSMGEKIMRGLLNGIESLIESIKNTVSNLVNDIIDEVTSLFGIFSPSRVMFGIGVNVVKGLEGGMEARIPNVLATTDAVGAAAMIAPAPPELGGVALARSAEGLGAQIIFQGPVYGTRDFDERVSVALARLNHDRST